MKHHSLVQFVCKSACFLKIQILQIFYLKMNKIHLFSILNTKQTNYGIFWIRLGKTFIWQNFLKSESSILNTLFTHLHAQQHLLPDTYLHLQLGSEQ